MATLKLSLPYTTAIRLNDSQRLKLINIQAKKLGFEDWEILALIEFCKENCCINPGLAIVYEYSNCVENILSTTSQILFILNDCLGQSKSGEDLLRCRITFTALLYKLVFVLARWRKLQWFPIPILVHRKDLISEMALVDVLSINITNLRQLIDRAALKGNLGENEFRIELLGLRENHYNQAFQCIDDFIDCERKIFDFWQSQELSDARLPVLRLPVDSGKLEKVAWLVDTMRKYEKITNNAKSVISQFCSNLTANEVEMMGSELYQFLLHSDKFDGNISIKLLPFSNDWANIRSTNPLNINYGKDTAANIETQSSSENKDLSSVAKVNSGYSDALLYCSSSEIDYNQMTRNSQLEIRVDLHAASFYQRKNSFSPTENAQRQGMVHSGQFNKSLPRAPRTRLQSDPIPSRPMTAPVKHQMNLLHTSDEKFARYRNESFSVMYKLLKMVDERDCSLQVKAAQKIKIWLKWMWPKFKLAKRRQARNTARAVIDYLIDATHNKVMFRQKRRILMLRVGAAIKVQRGFRNWLLKLGARKESLAIDRRRQRVSLFMKMWSNCVLGGIRVYRYVRYIGRKIAKRRGMRLVSYVPIQIILDCYITMLGLIYRKQSLSEVYLDVPAQRKYVLASFFDAVSIVQKVFRRYRAIKLQKRQRLMRSMTARIALFLIRVMAKKRMRQQEAFTRAAITIQRFIRGACLRRWLSKFVITGLRLKDFWKKHVAYKNLKSQLRRLDRPFTIVMRGLRNINPNYINLPVLTYKISVMWNPLLHIVSKDDFDTVIQSKQPQYVYQSIPAKVNQSTTSKYEESNVRTRASSIAALNFLELRARKPSRAKNASSIAEATISENEEENSAASSLPKVSSSNSATAFGTRDTKFPEDRSPQLRRCECNFENAMIKIPGCHGNSVIKFEIFDGERRLGHYILNLGKEGGLMYWGGEYQVPLAVTHMRRSAQVQLQILTQTSALTASTDESPVLEFQIIAGAPLRARCQWVRVIIRGSNKIRRPLRRNDLLSYISLFDSWQRFYLSLDQFGLFIFENKYDSKHLLFIPVCRFKMLEADYNSMRSPRANSLKGVLEDPTNLILTTQEDDEIFIRFPDGGARVAWEEAISNAIKFSVKDSEPISNNWIGVPSLSPFSKSSDGRTTTQFSPNSKLPKLPKLSSSESLPNSKRLN